MLASPSSDVDDAPQRVRRPVTDGSTGKPVLVVTKLAPPVAAPGVIARPRLLQALWSATTHRLTLVDAGGETSDLVTEYVVLGTGYDVDIDAIPFVDDALAGRIRRIERSPDLNRHFESSVTGLYFIGPSSALSFGPLFRFVAGARYAVPHVAAQLDRRTRKLS